MRDKRLKPEAKAIYAYLCSFAGNDKVAYPSVSLMCDELGMGRDRFYKYRSQLEDMGYVEVRQVKDGTRFARNVYVLLDGDIEDTESPCTENKDTENEATENQYTNKNSSTSNSLTSNNSTKNREIRKRKRFTPPTREEVVSYIQEMGYGLDADEFIDKNEMRGWRQNNGRPIVDWRACVRTFERNRKRWAAERGDGAPEKAKRDEEWVRTEWGMCPRSVYMTEEQLSRLPESRAILYRKSIETVYDRKYREGRGNGDD